MAPAKKQPSAETLHQWAIIESARDAKGTPKKAMSAIAEMENSYYYQNEKYKRAIPLDILTKWARHLEVPFGKLFLEGDADPRARIISLIETADEDQLPQALRVLEAVLSG